MLSDDAATIRMQCLELVLKTYGAGDLTTVLTFALHFAAFVQSVDLPLPVTGGAPADDEDPDADPPMDGEVFETPQYAGPVANLGRARV